MELCGHNVDVDVVEQCRVSPASGGSVLTSPAASLPLTFFDLLWLSLPPVHRLFFFDFQGSKTDFFDTVVPKLKHSLSLTLQHFYPLAGNLTWPLTSSKPQISCTPGHDSVAFTVAVSHQDFCHLSANQNRQASMFAHLLPELSLKSSTDDDDIKAYPVLAVQVTLFPDKGICIGLTYHHSAADGRSLIHFFKSWASICDATTTEPPLVCCDRNLVSDPKGIDMYLLNNRIKNITKHSFNLNINDNAVAAAQDKFAATFVIRPSDIKKLRQCVITHFQDLGIDPPQYLSTFVLTCAYVWVCLIKARWGSDPTVVGEGPSYEYLIFPMDCRGRREPPLPATYFGNCVVGAIIKMHRKDQIISEQGVAIAAKLIGNAVQRKEDGTGILTNTETVSSNDFLSAVKGGQLITVAGSTKLGIYGTSFGWGELKKVEVASIASSGAMSLCECPGEVGAVEVGLIRNKMEMDAFTTVSATILEALP